MSSIRFWFALGAAIVAASIADPLVEAASNAGWFGAGNFSDHSNLDAAPGFALGALLVVLHLVLRVRSLLLSRDAVAPSLRRAAADAAARSVLRLLPLTFVLQLAALFTMETVEQIVVFGHPLGGTIWLGGPAGISLFVHATACALVLLCVSYCVRALAARTVRAIRAMYARDVARSQTALGTVRRALDPTFRRFLPVPCRIGERAPPLFPRA